MKISILVVSVLLIAVMGMVAIAADSNGLSAPPNPGTMPPTAQCAATGQQCGAAAAGSAANSCCPGLTCKEDVCVQERGFFARVLNFFGIGSAPNPPEPGEDQGVQNMEPSTNGQDQGASGGANGEDQGTQPGTGGQDMGGETGGQAAPVGPPTSQPPGACCRVTICERSGREFICPPGEDCAKYEGCHVVTCGVPADVTVQGCTYNGQAYREGASFLDSDGCNTCSCTNGRVVCTQKACRQCTASVQTCYPEANGEAGAPVQCTGKYNDCVAKYGKCDCGVTATAQTTVTTQTTKTCAYNGAEYKEGETFQADDGCNTCVCKDGRVTCTEKACATGGSGLTAR